ncbi:TonB-dependent receptor [Cellvibrio mixtus]|uniref:TonB-dependent receptor n=1 Tax=Cellvibrio mixtus TaxID=39650 RepID=A0A266Q1M8_9GAMM|nr:TonB-dependent receptor [Cellvibrio mixtus]OZY83750.1 TonB-dependent receptor [Cellvibrio mixtus]
MTFARQSVALISLAVAAASVHAHESTLNKKRTSNPQVEEVRVWGEARDASHAGYTNPASVLTQEDMVSINATTTEDLVKFEPSLVIRKRYIGDSNGTLGLRGSNMFATPRSMVFADGVPLHYLLQTRWNGAPRWTMVSASEIAQVEILYGPFSAEYSGNAMGGVVLIETALPQTRKVHVDLDYFSQDFSAYGFSDRLTGTKSFFSYGDKLGDLSVYVSYNHLENESQPQSFYYDYRAAPTNGFTPVTGAVVQRDVYGKPAYYYGDTGVEQATTDNFKIKLGYDFSDDWSALLNLAYEDRNTLRDAANTYVRDADGNKVWAGNLVQDGIGMNIAAGRLGNSDLERKSLSTGLRVKGKLSDQLSLETNLSDFRILKDNTLSSSRNPQDPLFNNTGLTTDYDDTGWQTLDAKLVLEDVGLDGMQWIGGLRHEAYRLNLDQYNSANWLQGDNAGYTSRSGGETGIDAAFVQLNWDIAERWDLALGGRYEQWESKNGYFSRRNPQTSQFELMDVDDVSRHQFSPKFSLGYVPADEWLVRYSAARAYRFPIVEELFSQSQSYSSSNVPRPDLKPENGLHHNLMLEKQFESGYARINVFSETIEDAIESQNNYATLVNTFSSVDEVQTDGVEFILNYSGLLVPELDARFNVTYTKSIIEDNSTAEGPNPATTIEGNDYPRMPRWRSNLLLTYHLSDKWDLSGNLQYADKSYGRLQNDDIAEGVMGAQDGYTRVGLKTTYDLSEQIEVGLGVDNLTDEQSFVAHPWPGRTMYLSLSYDM